MEARLHLSIRDLASALGVAPLATAPPMTRPGGWVRRPVHVLRDALTALWPLAAGTDAVEGNKTAWEWLAYTNAGAQWRLRQMLVYPSVLARPDFLTTASPAPAEGKGASGWPIDATEAAAEEWIRLDPAAYGTRGGAGEAGGHEQLAGLYWEDGAAHGGDPDAALRIDLATAVASVAPLAAHV